VSSISGSSISLTRPESGATIRPPQALMARLLDSVRRSLLRSRTIWVFFFVVAGNLALDNPRVRENLPFITTLQLRAHAILSHLDFRQEVVKWVAVVPIEDDCFWKPPFSGRQPTNRRAIANLADAAANADAAVIAIDFLLLRTAGSRDDPAFEEENRYLIGKLTSIATDTRRKNIVRRGRPVVLGTLLVADADRQWLSPPNIFDDEVLPPAIRRGFLNLPNDVRRLPLRTIRATGENLDSFALAIVKAREEVGSIAPGVLDDPRVKRALEIDRPLLAGFNRARLFRRVSACDVLEGKPEALQQLTTRTVIIGSAWHKYAAGTGPLEESVDSPVGELPGVYMHANYVEALLTNAYKPAAGAWAGPTIDLLVGIALYLAFALVKSPIRKAGVLGIFFLPLICAYVLLASAGWYLDFVALMFLFFVDLAFELYHSRGFELPAASAAYTEAGKTP
jgi:hypothetical protein